MILPGPVSTTTTTTMILPGTLTETAILHAPLLAVYACRAAARSLTVQLLEGVG